MRDVTNIIIIGPPASGKTTAANHLASRFSYQAISDIDPLLELAKIHRLDLRSLRDACSSWVYWPEFNTQDEIELLKFKREFCLALTADGFRIISPQIWDEALSRCSINKQTQDRLIIEFARGRDNAYLEMFNLKLNEVYSHAFKHLPIFQTDILSVLEISCSFDLSLARNETRRRAGHRSVSDKSMLDIYGVNPLEAGGREDLMHRISTLMPGSTYYYHIIENQASVEEFLSEVDRIFIEL
jgi:hypothetical protein